MLEFHLKVWVGGNSSARKNKKKTKYKRKKSTNFNLFFKKNVIKNHTIRTAYHYKNSSPINYIDQKMRNLYLSYNPIFLSRGIDILMYVLLRHICFYKYIILHIQILFSYNITVHTLCILSCSLLFFSICLRLSHVLIYIFTLSNHYIIFHNIDYYNSPYS